MQAQFSHFQFFSPCIARKFSAVVWHNPLNFTIFRYIIIKDFFYCYFCFPLFSMNKARRVYWIDLYTLIRVWIPAARLQRDLYNQSITNHPGFLEPCTATAFSELDISFFDKCHMTLTNVKFFASNFWQNIFYPTFRKIFSDLSDSTSSITLLPFVLPALQATQFSLWVLLVYAECHSSEHAYIPEFTLS